MILNNEMLDEAFKGFEDFKKMGIFVQLDEKAASESPEQQKKYNAIKKNISKYLSKKDLKGCLKYLENVKKEL